VALFAHPVMQALRSPAGTSNASKSFPEKSIPHCTRKVFPLATKVLPSSPLQTIGVVTGGPGVFELALGGGEAEERGEGSS
jgi:hypothetical protein